MHTPDAPPMPFSVSVADIEAAADRLRPYIQATPLLTSRALSAACDCDLRLKAEHLQRSGSFKIRGALNRLLCLSPDEARRGVVAFSSGNHAQGVALAGQLLSIPATIVMPADAPAVKLAATRGYGAEVITYDRHTEDREAIARRICADRGATLVPPFDDPHVIAGQGTVGLEIAQAWPSVEIALIPVGGGGLASGVALALKSRCPDVRILGVEPAAADDARQSLHAGHIVRIPQPRTIADGVATQAIGRHTFPILRALLDDIIPVSEPQILAAMEFILTRTKQLIEPTGALSTAVALSRLAPLSGRRVVSILCGGNLDVAPLIHALS